MGLLDKAKKLPGDTVDFARNALNPLGFMKSLDYTNFTVRLRDWNYGQFMVEVTHSPVGRMRAPDLARFRSDVLPFLDKLENPGTEDRLTKEDLIEFGEVLGDMLFPPRVRRMLQKSLAYVRQQKQGLRLLLVVDDPLLSVLPWEYVYLWEYAYVRGRENDPMDGFLARDPLISIVRHESFVEMPEKKEAEPITKLRVFAGMAQPTDFGQELELDKEFRKIKRALESDISDDIIEMKELRREDQPETIELGEDIDAKIKEWVKESAVEKLLAILLDALDKKLKKESKEKSTGEQQTLHPTPAMLKDVLKGLKVKEKELHLTSVKVKAWLKTLQENLEGEQDRVTPEKLREWLEDVEVKEQDLHPDSQEAVEKELAIEERHLHLTPAMLESACEEGVHIFHFSGHGGFFPEAMVDKNHRFKLDEEDQAKPSTNGQANAETQPKSNKNKIVRGAALGGAGLGTGYRGAIVLEKALPTNASEASEENKEVERPHYILWSDTLAGMLRQGNIQIVVLNSCKSATRDPRKFLWTGVAPALLKAKVPAVVAMQFSISDNTAIKFSENLYKALAAGLSLDTAVAYGRKAVMDLEEGKRDQDWGIPVLYTRSEEGVFFPELAKENRKKQKTYYDDLLGHEYEEFYKDLKKPLTLKEIKVSLLFLLFIVVVAALVASWLM